MHIIQKSPKVAALSLERQVVHAASAPGSACTHNTAVAALQITSTLMMLEKEKQNCLRFEAGLTTIFLSPRSSEQRGGQIWHNLKHSFGEHQELVQPGRMKMPKATQRLDRLGRMACMDRKKSGNLSLSCKTDLVLVSLVLRHISFMLELWHRYSLLGFFTCCPRKFSHSIFQSIGKYYFSFSYGWSHKKPRARVFFTQRWIRPTTI